MSKFSDIVMSVITVVYKAWRVLEKIGTELGGSKRNFQEPSFNIVSIECLIYTIITVIARHALI